MSQSNWKSELPPRRGQGFEGQVGQGQQNAQASPRTTQLPPASSLTQGLQQPSGQAPGSHDGQNQPEPQGFVLPSISRYQLPGIGEGLPHIDSFHNHQDKGREGTTLPSILAHQMPLGQVPPPPSSQVPHMQQVQAQAQAQAQTQAQAQPQTQAQQPQSQPAQQSQQQQQQQQQQPQPQQQQPQQHQQPQQPQQPQQQPQQGQPVQQVQRPQQTQQQNAGQVPTAASPQPPAQSTAPVQNRSIQPAQPVTVAQPSDQARPQQQAQPVQHQQTQTGQESQPQQQVHQNQLNQQQAQQNQEMMMQYMPVYQYPQVQQLGYMPPQQNSDYRPLNVTDALTYLDQVKAHFRNQPDVYNHFLDIMKDFKSHAIDTPGVIDRVSSLFRGHTNLIQGFNTFLPAGYRIECSLDPHDPNPIRVTTPMGPQIVPVHGREMSSVQGQMGPPAPPNGTSSQDQQSHQQLQFQNLQAAAANQSSPRQGGPVEFNHAISYVNKIKNRFSHQPEIYKAFLEILQTYQREQLRISEVYTQVTHLFRDASDLLDDFKHFLPEAGGGMGPVAMREDMRLPPVGSFGPPGGQQPATSQYGQAQPVQVTYQQAQTPQGQPQGQAQLQSAHIAAQSQIPGQAHVAAPQVQSHIAHSQHAQMLGVPAPSATVVGLPGAVGMAQHGSAGTKRSGYHLHEDLNVSGPASRKSTLSEEIGFFDKVKKLLPKTTYQEFLKVLNLFTQRIIDLNTLVEKVDTFIGQQQDLMNWFKRFVGYEGKPLVIENVVHRKHLVDLAQCRAYGPSYRLLPKSETFMPSSGRDELCWEVLNDEWVGHPTWASEDSGFVAHRKNQYEEILYRVEEERHEYDHWIGANQRSIQVLETIANRIASMSPKEQASFRLPPGLGNDNKIYQKVIIKIYDRKNGTEVISALHNNPGVAVPIVLRRLKQKDEEWRRAQREWNKVWREAEQKAFYKSLDHIGLTFKQADRKQLTSRALLGDIMAVKAEQTAKRRVAAAAAKPPPAPKSHLDYDVSDHSVLSDVISLILKFLEHRGTYSAHDREAMGAFIRSFLPKFFGAPEIVDKKEDSSLLTILKPSSSSSESASGASSSETERKTSDIHHNGSSNDLTGTTANNGTNGSSANGVADTENTDETGLKAEESTSVNGVSATAKSSAKDTDQSKPEADVTGTWLKFERLSPPLEELQHPRDNFNLFANTPIYLFMRIFQIIYQRLVEVKSVEPVVTSNIKDEGSTPYAIDLGLYDGRLDEMGLRFTQDHVYEQALALCNRLLEDEVEPQWFEEALRQAYRNRAYKLYTIDKALQSLVKQLHLVITDSGSIEALLLWEQDCSEPKTDVRSQIVYRMRVKQAIGGADEPLFRIGWTESKHTISFQYLGAYDLTLKGVATTQQRWEYYVTSYMMSIPTEGVPLDQIRPPLLQRALPEDAEIPEDKFSFEILAQNLRARIDFSTYKLFFERGTTDYIVNLAHNSVSPEKAHESRKKRWAEILEQAEKALTEREEEAAAEEAELARAANPDIETIEDQEEMAVTDEREKSDEGDSGVASEVTKDNESNGQEPSAESAETVVKVESTTTAQAQDDVHDNQGTATTTNEADSPSAEAQKAPQDAEASSAPTVDATNAASDAPESEPEPTESNLRGEPDTHNVDNLPQPKQEVEEIKVTEPQETAPPLASNSAPTEGSGGNTKDGDDSAMQVD